jgi:glutathione S-transferase
MSQITLYGVQVSPYVRKVALALAFKGIEYQLVPVVPIGDDQPALFKENSPTGKIPLLQVGDDFITDSAIICYWLEREFPEVPLLPANNLLAAKALWFHEYANSTMSPVISGHLFAEVVLAPTFFKREPIQSDIDTALETEIPEILDYLTAQLSGDYLVGDSMTLADIAVGGLFIPLQLCDYQIDSDRWPEMAAYNHRLLSSELFKNALTLEKQILASLQS